VIESLLVVGRGSLGRAVARVLRRGTIRVTTTSGRSPSARAIRSARAILLAVPDPVISLVSEAIAPLIASKTVVLHAAGSRRSDELEAIRRVGGFVGVMHPLVSFARGASPRGFDGAISVLDGDPRAVRVASDIARALGTEPVRASVHGPSYHAAAALVANGAVALVHEGVRILVGLGFSRHDAEAGLAGMLGTVVDNVRSVGVPEALTGPIARGDVLAVAAHREALRGDARSLAAYDAISKTILGCSRDRGLPVARARAIDSALGTSAIQPRRSRRRARS